MGRYLQMQRWEPFRDLLGVQRDLSRILEREDVGLTGTWSPAMDIHESEDAFTVSFDVPGMTADDVEITLDRNMLTVKGQRGFSSDRREEDYRRIERHYGAFERSVSLPATVDADGIDASVTDGVLEVVIPKAAEARPRQIKVGGGTNRLPA